jgi:flagellar basal-body rod protein FlgB
MLRWSISTIGWHRNLHPPEATGMSNSMIQAFDFQAQALVLRAERQRLIASNIANADTPGYQARDMDFAKALREATGAMPIAGAMATTSAGHMAPTAGARDEAELLYASHSQDSVDRNTVDLERERHSAADNAVKYEATLRFINSSVRNMLDAMKSPNQG